MMVGRMATCTDDLFLCYRRKPTRLGNHSHFNIERQDDSHHHWPIDRLDICRSTLKSF